MRARHQSTAWTRTSINTGASEVISLCVMLQVLDTLAEINERHEAVKELEKSLMELHQVFLDMAVLVEAQGEMLDNIEQQVAPLNPASHDYLRVDSMASDTLYRMSCQLGCASTLLP